MVEPKLGLKALLEPPKPLWCGQSYQLSPATADTSDGSQGPCMDDVTRIGAAKAAWNASSGLDSRGRQHGFFRRAMRAFIHFFSYHFILSRQSIRSEEHTSELQSPCNLVCRLLLEKKKTTRS